MRRWDLVSVVLNGVIGAGIFGLPSKVFGLAGDYSLLAFGICALCVAIIAYGPDIRTFEDESCLGAKGEAWENQMKTDAENARSLSVLARGGCRMDESAPAASHRVSARGESSTAGAAR